MSETWSGGWKWGWNLFPEQNKGLRENRANPCQIMVGDTGFEPVTPCMSSGFQPDYHALRNSLNINSEALLTLLSLILS
jgi:hypothetical protein